MVNSLFGEDFEITIKQPKLKDLTKKINEPKEIKVPTAEKILKSKKLSLQERLDVITGNVNKILGKQKSNIIVIRDRATFTDYVTKAITSGRIAVDTETNNSLDPITCKLMGLCLYYPGGKQAYIPINHRDPETKEKLLDQLTEKDCQEQLQRINDSKIEIIMHNGKFDYEVIKCTCDITVIPTWDTMVAARLLNENEPAGLKWQYINKIDLSQEKYSIDHLFENVAYADVDPDIFALYAATDALLTDKLYELQHKALYSSYSYKKLDVQTDNFEVYNLTQIETARGYVAAKDLTTNDKIKTDNDLLKINKLVNNFNKIIIYFSLN